MTDLSEMIEKIVDSTKPNIIPLDHWITHIHQLAEVSKELLTKIEGIERVVLEKTGIGKRKPGDIVHIDGILPGETIRCNKPPQPADHYTRR